MFAFIRSLFCLLALIILLSSPLHAAVVDVFEAPGADGYIPWNHATNIATYNDWLAAVGETPDFKEDWDNKDWQGNSWTDGQLFDIQDVPTAVFADGVSFGNIGAQADRHAIAEDSIGSTDAIDLYGWRAHESGPATVFFNSVLGADYLGFYIFDTDHGATVDYKITFSDSSVFLYSALATEEEHYRFVGFVNRHATAKFTKFEVFADDATRYGIDELEWGRINGGQVIPEPATLILISLGLLALPFRRKS